MAAVHDMDMDMDSMHDMPMNMPDKKPMAMMHMTFFWGKDVDILFSGWPGYDRLGMYLLALFFVFALAVTVEFLSRTRFLKTGGSNRILAGLAQTGLHAVRAGLAYMVMLAVMSFNVGVLIAAVVGHAVGFLVFGSRVFKRDVSAPDTAEKDDSHLTSMKC